MKVTKRQGDRERLVLTAMVVHPHVLARIAAAWRADGLFRTTWANTVAGWCVGYYRTYAAAPMGHIEELFEDWANERQRNEEDTALMERFLGHLSDEYEQHAEGLNPDYVIDEAGKYFNNVALEAMAEEVDDAVQRQDPVEAEKARDRYQPVQLGTAATYNMLSDAGLYRDAFAEENVQPLFRYPGRLGRFFDNTFARDEFVAFMGSAGMGKTWWLMDLAWMAAARNKLKVAFFAVGDMSLYQVARRFGIRATARPKTRQTVAYPNHFEGEWVTNESGHQEFDYNISHEDRLLDACNGELAAKTMEQRLRRGRWRPDSLKLSVHANGTISIDGVAGKLDQWERVDGWTPDMVVIDYADLLTPPAGYSPGDREAINATWKLMRGLSQTRRCCLATATQADAGSYTAELLRRTNFSDDRRKIDHVTTMVGINTTDKEKDLGIYRLNYMKRREEAFNEGRVVHVAGCLAVGRPWVLSAG